MSDATTETFSDEAERPIGPPAVPQPGECYACFTERMTEAYGCSDRLLWPTIWRDRCAPRATGLERRLGSRGGYCDCEVLMNAVVRREHLSARLPYGTWTEEDEALETRPAPPCAGVRPGSSQVCAHWY